MGKSGLLPYPHVIRILAPEGVAVPRGDVHHVPEFIIVDAFVALPVVGGDGNGGVYGFDRVPFHPGKINRLVGDKAVPVEA